MTDATKDRSTPGFSSRWMLDGRERAGAVPGSARATANPIDTDGDGIADVLDVRVDADRRSFMRSMGTWLARSIVTILLVAAIVAAVAAVTSLAHTREELAAARQDAGDAESQVATLRAELDDAQARVTRLERDAQGAGADADAVTAERDELALEVRVLRRMLLDAERRAADA